MTERKTVSVAVMFVSREQFIHVLMERLERQCSEEAERLRKEDVAKRYRVDDTLKGNGCWIV